MKTNNTEDAKPITYFTKCSECGMGVSDIKGHKNWHKIQREQQMAMWCDTLKVISLLL